MRARHTLWTLVSCSVLSLVAASYSQPRPRSLRDESARQHARRAQAWTADALPKTATGPGFTALDHDGDGYLSFQELVGGQKMIWTSADNADRAHTAFNLPMLTPESFAHLDLDQDGRLSKAELAEHVTALRLPEDQDDCNAMAHKLDMCATSTTLRCSSYLATADSLCRTGHESLVERCIASSPCEDICNCIEKVELAAHGLHSVIVQDPPVVQALQPFGSTNATSMQLYQRQIPIFGLIIALILAIIGITAEQLALLSEDIIMASVAGARSMDFKIWADGANPPSCSVYLFWSHSCGAILSHGARTCSNGGTRVFGNSCKDHFRYGSAGCGFLSLGCKSLCYGVNQQNCPCSMFRWNEQDDVDYPGNDLSKMHVDVTSECRTACEGNPECFAFELLPWDGTKTQVNCLLKSAAGTPTKSKGVTSFIKLGGTEATCADDIQGGWGLFDRRRDLAWNDELFGPRPNATNVALDKAPQLGIRASDPPDGPWPFNPRDITFLVIATFLRAFYDNAWVNRDVVANTYGYAITPIGQNRLVADPAEPVADLTNPRWRIAESWRVLDVYRAVLNAANATGNAQPVQAFLSQQGNSGLDAALFPPTLRTVLIANEQAIQAGGQPWVGRNVPMNMGGVPPNPNINVVHAGPSGVRYYQARLKDPHSRGLTSRDLVEELIGEEREDTLTHTPDRVYEILNDVVLDRGPNPTMSQIELFGDDEHFTTLLADGICIATPTGSTAYNLAAGGSLSHPENPVILVTAICAHTLSFRPIILPDTIVLRMGVPYDARTSSWASFDGRERVELHPGDYVTVSASRYPFANVLPQGRRGEDWVHSISKTLNWNSRQKQKSFK